MMFSLKLSASLKSGSSASFSVPKGVGVQGWMHPDVKRKDRSHCITNDFIDSTRVTKL